VKVIHIAERDTQSAVPPKRAGEFVNTWSVEGFVGEGIASRRNWVGRAREALSGDGRRHDFGSGCAIYLQRPGASTRVRTWSPLEGPFHGFLITHSESISIADFLTVYNGDQVALPPTVHYSYHRARRSFSIHELAGKNWQLQDERRVLMDDIESGIDELGVLLMGHAKAHTGMVAVAGGGCPQAGAVQQRHQLQVSCSILGAIVWTVENPSAASSIRRNGLRARHRDRQAIPGQAHRQLQQLDAAVRARRVVSRGRRCIRSLAVQEFPGV